MKSLFFKDKKFTKAMIMLAIPVGLQNLITAVLNVFDQVMVGLLPPSMADAYLAAVTNVNQIVLIYTIIIFAICNAINVFIAQYQSDDHKNLIPQRVGVALSICVVAGIVMTLACVFFSSNIVGLLVSKPKARQPAIDFLSVVAWSFIPMAISGTFSFVLRAIKKLRGVVIAQLIGVLCNILFNYLLMFGVEGFIPAYGFIGAAYGTIISRVIEAILVVGVVLINKYPVVAKPSVMFKWDKDFGNKFIKVFLPILFNELSWALSLFVFFIVYNKLDNAIVITAAQGIMGTVDRLVNVFVMGVGSAACVIMGNKIGENDKEGIRTYSNYCLQFGLVTGLFVGAIMIATAFFAPSLFVNVSLEAQSMATNLIIIYGVTAVFRAMCFMIIVGILRSGGDTTFCLIAESIIIWFVSVPLVMVGGLVFGLNIYILVGLTMFAELIKAVVTYIRVKSQKWIKILD